MLLSLSLKARLGCRLLLSGSSAMPCLAWSTSCVVQMSCRTPEMGKSTSQWHSWGSSVHHHHHHLYHPFSHPPVWTTRRLDQPPEDNRKAGPCSICSLVVSPGLKVKGVIWGR
ncbi:hypothetical protein CCUS01_06664 [Colletotrichum cuscutae]|uniref:Secreted protein n=1 Tax=Colletotrichum cuscutae TaxID=1209917 RepID=A0AAI9Y0V5_9PEZI|nr:hypothetical protein CCUS01_06664 [Colletotrichum cuscutae]